jgi:hypothetical protein
MRTSILSVIVLSIYFSNYNSSVKRYCNTFKLEVHTIKPLHLDKLFLVSQSDCYFNFFTLIRCEMMDFRAI